jgi:hypothetical protein
VNLTLQRRSNSSVRAPASNIRASPYSGSIRHWVAPLGGSDLSPAAACAAETVYSYVHQCNVEYDDLAHAAAATAVSVRRRLAVNLKIIMMILILPTIALSLKEPQLVEESNSTINIWDYFGFKADKNCHTIDNEKPLCPKCY